VDCESINMFTYTMLILNINIMGIGLERFSRRKSREKACNVNLLVFLIYVLYSSHVCNYFMCVHLNEFSRNIYKHLLKEWGIQNEVMYGVLEQRLLITTLYACGLENNVSVKLYSFINYH